MAGYLDWVIWDGKIPCGASTYGLGFWTKEKKCVRWSLGFTLCFQADDTTRPVASGATALTPLWCPGTESKINPFSLKLFIYLFINLFIYFYHSKQTSDYCLSFSLWVEGATAITVRKTSQFCDTGNMKWLIACCIWMTQKTKKLGHAVTLKAYLFASHLPNYNFSNNTTS